MFAADRLRAVARDYELNARAYADQPTADARLSAMVFTAVALALSEIADALDGVEIEEAA